MKVFTCNDFTGHWPVGTAAIVVAEDKRSARQRLRSVLEDHGLTGTGFTLEEVDITEAQVKILVDGNY